MLWHMIFLMGLMQSTADVSPVKRTKSQNRSGTVLNRHEKEENKKKDKVQREAMLSQASEDMPSKGHLQHPQSSAAIL